MLSPWGLESGCEPPSGQWVLRSALSGLRLGFRLASGQGQGVPERTPHTDQVLVPTPAGRAENRIAGFLCSEKSSENPSFSFKMMLYLFIFFLIFVCTVYECVPVCLCHSAYMEVGGQTCILIPFSSLFETVSCFPLRVPCQASWSADPRDSPVSAFHLGTEH